VNVPKHLDSNVAYDRHNFYGSLFSLQCKIDGLGGFHGTHYIRSEIDHTIVSYLPAFAIALPPDECLEAVCAPLSSK
jgi:hypothetical protein